MNSGGAGTLSRRQADSSRINAGGTAAVAVRNDCGFFILEFIM
jgi:hypothetical protein